MKYPCTVRDSGEVGLAVLAEPTARIFGERLLGGGLGSEEVTPDIEHLLEHHIHLGVEKKCEPAGGAHRPVENRVDGYADHPFAVRAVTPIRCGRHEVVE